VLFSAIWNIDILSSIIIFPILQFPPTPPISGSIIRCSCLQGKASQIWLAFAFQEVLKVNFQKRMGMQKERVRSGLAFHSKAPPRSIQTAKHVWIFRFPLLKRKAQLRKWRRFFFFPRSQTLSRSYVVAFLLEWKWERRKARSGRAFCISVSVKS